MEEPLDSVKKSFDLLPKHISYLETINKNQSLALRTVLDRAIQNKDRSVVKTTIDNVTLYLIVICFGLLFIALAVLLEGFAVVIPTLIGTAILIYGLMGGVYSALSRAK